ncbi:hypothetical protein CSAL01_12638 [Colletotrichum salicis]|uniref:Uncharacterized protein n=1 Tax=Colletotrichum salicis TaxID=1209931 RepID=A0A135V2Y7_9PEZI|nr:hypothetical protein CSAL01_12638 [Colletotrichum salicis]
MTCIYTGDPIYVLVHGGRTKRRWTHGRQQSGNGWLSPTECLGSWCGASRPGCGDVNTYHGVHGRRLNRSKSYRRHPAAAESDAPSTTPDWWGNGSASSYAGNRLPDYEIRYIQLQDGDYQLGTGPDKSLPGNASHSICTFAACLIRGPCQAPRVYWDRTREVLDRSRGVLPDTRVCTQLDAAPQATCTCKKYLLPCFFVPGCPKARAAEGFGGPGQHWPREFWLPFCSVVVGVKPGCWRPPARPAKYQVPEVCRRQMVPFPSKANGCLSLWDTIVADGSESTTDRNERPV